MDFPSNNSLIPLHLHRLDWNSCGHISFEDSQKNRQTCSHNERNHSGYTSDQDVYVGKVVRQGGRSNSKVNYFFMP